MLGEGVPDPPPREPPGQTLSHVCASESIGTQGEGVPDTTLANYRAKP